MDGIYSNKLESTVAGQIFGTFAHVGGFDNLDTVKINGDAQERIDYCLVRHVIFPTSVDTILTLFSFETPEQARQAL